MEEYRSRKIRRVRDIIDDPFSANAVFRMQKTLSRFLSKWRETVGESMAEATAPYRFSKGVLFVACYDSLTIAELPYLKEELIEKLKTLSGEVADLRFTLAKHPKPSHTRKFSASESEPAEESAWIKQIGERTRDSELGEKFKAMLLARETSNK